MQPRVSNKLPEGYTGLVKITTRSSRMQDFVTGLSSSIIIEYKYLQTFLSKQDKDYRWFTVEEYNQD